MHTKSYKLKVMILFRPKIKFDYSKLKLSALTPNYSNFNHPIEKPS